MVVCNSPDYTSIIDALLHPGQHDLPSGGVGESGMVITMVNSPIN
jgi:hypothetical protein